MSTIKSSSANLTLNADGSGNDIKFQSNAVEKASISDAGLFTSTTIDATVLTGNLPAINAASLTNIPAANITGTLPAIDGSSLTGITGTVKSYAAGNIDMGTNIAGSYSAYTATGVEFSITTTASNSNLIVNASGWIGHVNPTANTGTQVKLYRKINNGSYGSTSTHHLYSDYIVGSASYSWDEMTGNLQLYDGPSHTAGDVITYQFYYYPHNSSGGYFHHTGGVGASTLSWSILEV